MKKLKPIGKEKITYSGKNFEIAHQNYQTGDKIKLFEIAKRSPGVRLIILDKKNNKILLGKEYRTELEDFDYRLPGGKVFDSKEERKNADYSQIETYASKAAIKECLEETGLITKNPILFGISKGGATLEWTLYYYVVENFEMSPTGQQLEDGEVITTGWYSMSELIELCKEGKVQEDRSLGMIFKFLLERGEVNINFE